jgi:hypothetical protein
MTTSTQETVKFDTECDIDKYKSPTRGEYVFDDVPLDDSRVWFKISQGHTKGVFQMETKLMQDWSRRVKPSNILELSDVIALVRPGPLESGQADEYVKRKNGEIKEEFRFNAIEDIMRQTYHTLTYQEQAIRIVQKLAGFTEEEADDLRKCVAGHCRFTTRDGRSLSVKEIAKLKKKDIQKIEVMTVDKNDNITYANLVDVWSNGEKTLVEIASCTGKDLYCTGDHKIRTQRGWIEAKDVKKDDYIMSLWDRWDGGWWRWDRVHTVRVCGGKDEVFDFTINCDTHCAFVDEVLVHNCLGKKRPEMIAPLKAKFVEGSQRISNVSKEEAEEIFGWIETGQRYSFNKCLDAGTIVQTNESSRRAKHIDQVKIGDKVLCPSGFRLVKDVIRGEKRPMFLCCFSLIQYDAPLPSIICSLEHKFLCNTGEVLPISEIFDNRKIVCTEYGNAIVDSISYVGMRESVDLEIDSDDHIFYANGIATSNSHSISYAHQAYYSAYMKVHFPTEFYTAWLSFSDWKVKPKEEVYELVQDAKMTGVEVLPPEIHRKNIDFEIADDKKIVFGLSHIKNVGMTAIKNIEKLDLSTWTSFLLYCKKLKRNVAEALIKSGACDVYGKSRTDMLRCLHVITGQDNENNIDELKKLTDKEIAGLYLYLPKNSLEDSLRMVIENKHCMAKRAPVIESKIRYIQTATQDTNKQKSVWEKVYLGLNLSCSAVDDTEAHEKDLKTCRDVYKGNIDGYFTMHVVIEEIVPKKTGPKAKNPGQKYCYLKVADNYGVVDRAICWPKVYDAYKDVLAQDMVIVLKAKIDKWNNRQQVVVDSIKIIG